MSNWSRAYWSDLGERVAATFVATFIPLYAASQNAIHLDWVNDVELAATAAGLSLLKGLLANLVNPASGPSLLPAPPAPEVEQTVEHDTRAVMSLGWDTPDPAAKADQARALVRVLPRTDPRLGRHIEHDPRSRAFPAPTTGAVVSKTWRHYGQVLDQGQLGSCTGNAMAQALNTHPLHRARTPYLTEADAVKLYEAATNLDDVPGAYPPQDTGSSGLAVAKAAQQAGYISAYTHAFGIDHVLAALMNGPLIVGTSWTQDMFTPDARHFVHPTGAVAGGHEYLLLGVNVERGYLTFLNSWGKGFGLNGRFHMTLDDFAGLLADQGDAVQPVPA